MQDEYTKSPIEQLIQSSENIAIIPSQVAGYDAFAAALGLFFSLKAKEKKVDLIYPGGVPEDFEELISDSEIVTDPSLRDLIVQIDYSNTPAQKVNYSTQAGVLTLKISPVGNNFSLDNVKAGLQSSGYDLIFVIGAQVKDDLGVSYNYLVDEFKSATVVNLDNTDRNSRFGTINIVDSSMDSLSQLVLNFMAKIGFNITPKPAKALLKGISKSLVN